ncbi:MAG: DNA-binding protein WhiA [Fusobacteriaceae bacterium]
MSSYSQKVKKEVMGIQGLSKLQIMGEIKAAIMGKGALNINCIDLKFENIALASRFYGLLQEVTKLRIGIKYSISKKFGEHKVYTVSIYPQKGYNEFIDSLRKITNSVTVANEEVFTGIIRGFFLYFGYIKSPEKEYALDFFIDSEIGAGDFLSLLLAIEKKASHTAKKNKNLVYLRNSEDIMDILVTVGALQEFFKYEETTMMKDLKNKTIREMNWEVANETKTLNSANRQLKMIEYIDNVCGLSSLTPVIKEIAEIRLRYSESSLQEIADMIGISKSGVKNRFRRLEEIYNKIKAEEGQEKESNEGNL